MALVLMVGLVACAANQLVVSGGVLDSLGNTFVTTAELYNSLHSAGKIADEDYRDGLRPPRQAPPHGRHDPARVHPINSE